MVQQSVQVCLFLLLDQGTFSHFLCGQQIDSEEIYWKSFDFYTFFVVVVFLDLSKLEGLFTKIEYVEEQQAGVNASPKTGK